ncbi:MAG: hypothetical protein KDG58_08920, partial [Anaerolineae bacterium]|nr:hypothetical protein [Anaerolineae bacterium]
GHLGLVGVSDLSMNTSGQMPLMTVDFRTIRTGLQRLLQHYPPESFVMVILVKRDMEKRLCHALDRLNLPFEIVAMDTVLAAVQESAVADDASIEASHPG